MTPGAGPQAPPACPPPLSHDRSFQTFPLIYPRPSLAVRWTDPLSGTLYRLGGRTLYRPVAVNSEFTATGPSSRRKSPREGPVSMVVTRKFVNSEFTATGPSSRRACVCRELGVNSEFTATGPSSRRACVSRLPSHMPRSETSGHGTVPSVPDTESKRTFSITLSPTRTSKSRVAGKRFDVEMC